MALACVFPGATIGADNNGTSGFFREIKTLAQTGDAEAQYALALLLDLGSGPAQDREEAITWLQKAAAQNLPAACFTLGMKYEFGATVPRDIALAATWYRQAALQDQPMAQYRLGSLYLTGNGGAPEAVPAFTWLSLAAEHGYPDAAEARDGAAALLLPAERPEATKMGEDLRQQIRQQRKK